MTSIYFRICLYLLGCFVIEADNPVQVLGRTLREIVLWPKLIQNELRSTLSACLFQFFVTFF
jgi:hypothetical protein